MPGSKSDMHGDSVRIVTLFVGVGERQSALAGQAGITDTRPQQFA
jgi:hypothetical protein